VTKGEKWETEEVICLSYSSFLRPKVFYFYLKKSRNRNTAFARRGWKLFHQNL